MTSAKRRTELITSGRNPFLKEVRRASLKGTLTADGCVVAESFHLLEEAIRADRRIPAVLCSDAVRATVESHVQGLKSIRVVSMPQAVFAELSSTESSQGVIALVEPPEWTLEQLFRGRSLVAVLDGVQDPGNAGAVVRAAEAFGATGVLFLKGAASPHNPKTLRASAGSLFRVPFFAGLDGEMARAALIQHRLDIYTTAPKGGKILEKADLTRRCAIVIGSEGRGVSENLRTAALDLHIPTIGVESLNAAMAAGIILYEARRQRALRA